MKKTTIGDYLYCQFTTLVNSASMAPLIGLPPKMAEFCHTSNRFLVRCGCCCALLWLYFSSSVAGRWSVSHWLKDNGSSLLSSLANRAKIAMWRAKRGLPNAEVMARNINKCNKQLWAYCTRKAAGSCGGGSLGRMLASLPMSATTVTNGSTVHLRSPLAAAAALTKARMLMAASIRGGKHSPAATATTAGIPAMHPTQCCGMLWPPVRELTGHH
jgi:hypothetical protein